MENLKHSMATLTKPSVDTVLKRIMSYVTRPLPEFNSYEALEMLDTLQNTAHDSNHEKAGFYRMAYQTARAKIDFPREQFRHLIMRLVGNKDLEKTLDILTKVEKTFRRARSMESRPAPYRRIQDSPSRSPQQAGPRCFYCNKIGHIQAHCFQKKRDLEAAAIKNSEKNEK